MVSHDRETRLSRKRFLHARRGRCLALRNKRLKFFGHQIAGVHKNIVLISLRSPPPYCD